MIDFVEGTVSYIENEYVVIEANGVGYQIFCPQPMQFLNDEGTKKRVYTHQTVREDFIGLYGFVSREERDLFRRLLDVSGVGPKGALGIIASGRPEQVVAAIQQEDVTFLTKFPGVGKKTAQRMILDLKDKLASLQTSAIQNTVIIAKSEGKSISEAFEALVSLGYQEKEVKEAFSLVANEITEEMSVDSIIKKILTVFFKR